MQRRKWILRFAVLATFGFAGVLRAGTIRVLPNNAQATPGAAVRMSVEIETEAGDNTVGVGYFSFAVDLTLSGTAGASGGDISNVVINTALFDDLFSQSLGSPLTAQYVGVSGVTTDFFAPTFGHTVGDRILLFDFDLTIPSTAELGDTIGIMPSEGALENLIATTAFDNVIPQRFEPTAILVTPDPATVTLLLAGCAALARRPRRVRVRRTSRSQARRVSQ